MRGGGGGGGQDGCEWRSKAFVKIQKKNFGGGGRLGGRVRGGVGLGGVRMDGNGEVKLVRKFKKKLGGGGGGVVGVGLGGCQG